VIGRGPAAQIEREEMRFLNAAEVARLTDAIGPRCRALVLLGAYGGLRMGELAGLRRGRVDLLRGTVDIAEIVVEVHGQLYTASHSNFRIKVWLPAVRAAGLAPLRPHDLRHTAVALWIAAGANPKEVSVRAGHTSVSFTLDRYGHLFPGHDTELRDRLDAMHAEGLQSQVT
jgi:integrase